jgi:glutamate dehydrogenase/leucine dehydrogenase
MNRLEIRLAAPIKQSSVLVLPPLVTNSGGIIKVSGE